MPTLLRVARRSARFRLAGFLFASLLAVGCADDTSNNTDTTCRGDRCDDTVALTTYVPDFEKLNALFPSERPMEIIEDAFTVRVDLGVTQFDAATHLFDSPLVLIPYANDDNTQDALGNVVARRDVELAKHFPVGAVGYAVKHHRPEFRDLKFEGGGEDMKEHFKLQDTHIEIVVGVERDGKPGVITLNNPQNYESGLFGTADYPMIFLRPSFPGYLSSDQRVAFNDNIRTMAAAFNAVSNFPGDYNGGDPLGARTPDAVIEHSIMMVKAIAGDAEAIEFFEDEQNQIYCAELAHVSASAGLIAPLNKRTFEPLVGADTWQKFVDEVNAHNSGEESAFLSMNDNKLVSMVNLTLAPESLQAAHTYAPSSADADKLAFQPMTMSDMVEQFMRTHLPRETLGESLGQAQAAVLTQIKPGLLESMAIDGLPESHPIRVAVDDVFDRILAVVAQDHGTYENFRTALAPLLAEAREITGPRDGSGKGLFVPPNLLHVIAQKKHDGGLLGLDYVGHGLHFSVLKPEGATGGETPGTDEPSSLSTCENRCDDYTAAATCNCDSECTTYGDCCSDLAQFCEL